jgi:GT2 family glycosyltransferase
MKSSNHSICAVICTRDRTDMLQRALKSLLPQPLDELLVVDNAPSDGRTEAMVRREFPGVRYVRESAPGLNFARNSAVAETARDIIAFIDDDAVAEPGWARHLVAAFDASPELGICTGRVLPLILETEAQRLFESQGGFDRGPERILMPGDARRRRMHGVCVPLIAWSIAIGVGANMAIKKDVAADIGGFDTALDHGSVLPGGGDVDAIWRVLASGRQVVYEPRALVLHEHRREMERVHAQILGHRRAEIAFLAKSARAAPPRAAAGIYAFLAWRLVKPGLRMLNRAMTGRDPLPIDLLWRLWRESWRGLTTYQQSLAIARGSLAANSSPND